MSDDTSEFEDVTTPYADLTTGDLALPEGGAGGLALIIEMPAGQKNNHTPAEAGAKVCNVILSTCDTTAEGTITYALDTQVDCKGANNCLRTLDVQANITSGSYFTGTIEGHYKETWKTVTATATASSGGGCSGVSGCQNSFPQK